VRRSAVLSLAPLAVLALCVAACDRQEKPKPQQQQRQPQARPQQAPRPGAAQDVTPMGERVAVLGLLNKRNGIVRNLTLRPGQSVRLKDVIVRLRACETTAPWETEKLTGAFVQVDVQRRDTNWERVFSGWLYKETPSLNVVQHPVYDVWPRSCAMTFPGGTPAPEDESSSNASSSRNSPGPSPSADDSNDT
jgi:hypothetical protein